MPRESMGSKRERAVEFCGRMERRYGDVGSALTFGSPFELVISVLLSAQTTDVAVNSVTPELFGRWPTPQALAMADPADVGEVIHRLGFWRAKSEHCVAAAQMMVSDFGGEVPHTMDELTRLPGVGRKTANIVLEKAFDTVDGIAVDTHVYRIATRLKFTNAPTPLAAEQDLLRLLPHELWKHVNEQWIHFGRDICTAQRPACAECPCQDICPSAFRANGNPRRKRGRKAQA